MNSRKICLAPTGALMALLTLLISFPVNADFGEIDLLVQESIENHFAEYGQLVDLNRLKYLGQPEKKGQLLTVQTSVWAEQGLMAPYWGWYECSTQLEILARGRYLDRGTTCWFEFD